MLVFRIILVEVLLTADGKWHLVHPVWSTKAIQNYRPVDEQVIEGGTSSALGPMQVVTTLNDFWFCTNPEIFATRCLPNEERWQNPNKPECVSVRSKKQFVDLPDLRQGFYSSQMSLLSKSKSVLKSHKGLRFVTVKANKENCTSTRISTQLSYLIWDESSYNTNRNGESMDRLILAQMKGLDTYEFEIRLPKSGIYWFRMFAKSKNDTEPRKCCEFKIICDVAYQNCKQFPRSHGLDVFGLSPKAVEAGLDKPSETGAKIVVQPNKDQEKTTLISFDMDQSIASDIDYESEMYGSDFVNGQEIEKSFTG